MKRQYIPYFLTCFVMNVIVTGLFASNSFGKQLDTVSLEATPNPFYDSTSICFTLIGNDTVCLEIYDRWGNSVASFLTDSVLQSGDYCFVFELPDSVFGQYFVLLSVNGVNFNELLLKITETEISELNKEYNIKAFPNPITDLLNVLVSDLNVKSISVTGIAGSKVSRQCYDTQLSGIYPIDLSALKPGLYILEIETNNGIFIRRFIKT